MTIIPQLLQHGEHLGSLYLPLPGQPAQRADDPQRQAGQGGILRHYDKHHSASKNPQALGWIKAVYPDAIEYTSKTQDLRGLSFAGGCFFGAVILYLGTLSGTFALHGFDDGPFYITLFFSVFALFGISLILIGIGMFIFALRLDFFHLSDQPIIFDRKHRRVYRLFNEMPPSLWGLFQSWPIHACVYEWDWVDAEHDMESVITGATATSNHFLMFAVRKSADDSTIIDSFQVSNAMSLNEALTDAMWEHIRRFMQANGPHLPTPDEPLAKQTAPSNWWQSLGATGTFGPGYWARWVTQPGIMLLMHLAGPVTVPMFLLWGTGNWLSYKTEIRVDWPDEVKEAVGASI